MLKPKKSLRHIVFFMSLLLLGPMVINSTPIEARACWGSEPDKDDNIFRSADKEPEVDTASRGNQGKEGSIERIPPTARNTHTKPFTFEKVNFGDDGDSPVTSLPDKNKFEDIFEKNLTA